MVNSPEVVGKYARLLTDCAKSNQSIHQYAQEHGLAFTGLYKWARYFRNRIAHGDSFENLVLPPVKSFTKSLSTQPLPEIVELPAPRFENTAAKPARSILATVTFKNQATMEISSDIAPEQLAMLIKAVSLC